ncbi:MAG TPA: TetR-like C-terminal domain-containing protein [Lapillicoccus sp.]|jgi:AcrR family transcriptional regulator|nr:TetR-like C-terminal domain-containing protein [Lapillicoccus sp.]
MSEGVRARRRDDVTRQVLEIGRRHLTQYGAAALSLRAVTRDLGMVSSAVYRYVGSRDELLTLLVVDAYTELGDAVDARLADAARAAWDTRILAVCNAVRDWALGEPARYALLYGSPVPGYEAPGEQTMEPGTRVILALLRLVAEGVTAGDVTDGPALVPVPRPLRADLARVAADVGMDVDPAVMARAVLLWATLFGAVSLEVFGQYGEDTFKERGLLFEQQIRLALTVVRG